GHYIGYNASLELTLNGGTGNDTLFANYWGEVNGLLKLRLDGASGSDTVKAAVDLKGHGEGKLDAKLLGGLDRDHTWFRMTEDATSDVQLVNALLDGGEGVSYGRGTDLDRYDPAKTSNKVTVVNFEGTYSA